MFWSKTRRVGFRYRALIIGKHASLTSFAAAGEQAAAPEFSFEPGGATLADCQASARQSAAVFVVEIDPADASQIEGLRSLMREAGERSQAVIIVARELNERFTRSLLHLQVADWLALPVDAGELAEACRRAVNVAGPEQDRHGGRQKIIGFTPVLGGLGATTLAIETALHLMGDEPQPGSNSTCLVDLDFFAGECPDYLDLPANLQLADIAGNPDRLDGHMLDAMLARHRSGLALLAARIEFGDSDIADADVVLRLLDLAAQSFTSLVIDIPRNWRDWTDGVLLGCSDLFYVADSSVPAIRAAQRMIEQVERRYGGDVKPRVIINKHRRKFFSFGAGEAEIRKVLGDHLAGFVSDQQFTVREAIDLGIPLREVSGGKRLSREIARILDATATATSSKAATP